MTFVRTATSGRNRSIVSSWNDETSHTKSRPTPSSPPRKSESGAPMLPARTAGRFEVDAEARRSISAIHVVVVDLPLVPVIAIQRFAPAAVSAWAIR